MAIQHAVADETIRDRQDATHDANECTLFILLVVLLARDGLFNLREGRPQEPQSEQEEDPGEASNERGPQKNEHKAQQ